jgi:hypothetical protein
MIFKGIKTNSLALKVIPKTHRSVAMATKTNRIIGITK